MPREKRIYILIVKVNKLFSFFFVTVFSKRNRKHVSPCFYRVIETLVKVWENSKKLWKHSPAARVPTAFLVLPNFHSCFYNSIETRYMFSISIKQHTKQFNIYKTCNTSDSLVIVDRQSIVWFCKSMMFSNVIVDITISRRSFLFSESCVEVPASLSDVGGFAVGALDLVNRSLSVLG